MMRRFGIPFLLAAMVAPATAAHAGDLDNQLAARKQQLTALTQQIAAATGPEFNVDHDLSVRIKVTGLQSWLASATSPSFVISARGIARSDDLVYQRGWYRVWFDTPQDEFVRISLAPFQLQAATGQLTLSTQAAAHAEARVFANALGIPTNVFCASNPDLQAQARATLTLGAPSDGSIPYVVRLTSPTTLGINVRCDLKNLPSYTQRFPIDGLAQELGKGVLDLGYKKTVDFPLPTSPSTTVTATLSTSDQAFNITSDALEVDTNVQVAAAPLRAPQ
jgi:hypothetical protein